MALSLTTSMAQTVDLTKTTIVYQKSESPLVGHMAEPGQIIQKITYGEPSSFPESK